MIGPPDGLLRGYSYCPAYWALSPERRARRALPGAAFFTGAQPSGIVIHSGADGPGTAEWAWKPEARYWAHFAWHHGAHTYVQTEDLRRCAPHVGSLNRFSWGIEMPGPWDEEHVDPFVRRATVALVRQLVDLGPHWLTGHEMVEDGKHDPGPRVTADWWSEMPGLSVYWTHMGGAKGLMQLEGLR